MENKQRNNVYFISDFHLGVPNKDESLKREKNIVLFLSSIEDDAKEVYLLGDVFDFWFEYKYVVPKGYVRLLGKIAQMCDNGIKVHFFCGNHDMWQRDYLEKELGVIVHKENKEIITLDDKVFMIGHGDGLDNKDFKYKFINFLFRNKFCVWLFGCLPTRFSMAIGNAWSKNSRKSHKKTDLIDMKEKEPIYLFCKKVLKNTHVDFFIFGHRHLVCDMAINNTSRYINVGCWINETYYAKWNTKELMLKRFEKD